MRCKKHCTDLSSIIGVCASCLRERLLKIIIAQEQAQAQAQSQSQNNCNSDTNPNPPLPRSVSPYISRQKSDIPVAQGKAVQRPYNKPRLNHSLSDQRFYNSPQIAINTGGCIGASSSDRKKQSLIRLSSFSNLFRSNNKNGDADSISGVSVSNSQKKKSSSVDESPTTASAGVGRKQRYVRDRGVSPVRSSDDGGEDEFSDGSSDYESAESCKQTPLKTPVQSTIRRGGGHKNVSELIFCLSPLVRASPNRLWNYKGKPPADGFDTRPPVVPHLSNVKSFCANRSRKLADFGRSDPNR